MIDIHSHALWGIDDGSPDLSTSVEMCRTASENGTEILFLTPHIVYWNQAEMLYDRREEKTEILEEIMEREDIGLKFARGFEILCDDDIFSIKYFKPYTLNGTRYILVEFDMNRTALEDVVPWLRYLFSNNLVPVVAHPERYSFVRNNISSLNILSDMGVLFQVNSGSLLGKFGEAEQNVALKMMQCGFVDFISSDAHDAVYRNTGMAGLFDEFTGDFVREVILNATDRNPRNLYEDKIIDVNRICEISIE